MSCNSCRRCLVEALGYGIQPVRMMHNDGSVNVMAGDGDDRKVVAQIQCQSQFKRGLGHKAECAERDANAEFIVRAVNSHDALVALLDRAGSQLATIYEPEDDALNALRDEIQAALLLARKEP